MRLMLFAKISNSSSFGLLGISLSRDRCRQIKPSSFIVGKEDKLYLEAEIEVTCKRPILLLEYVKRCFFCVKCVRFDGSFKGKKLHLWESDHPLNLKEMEKFWLKWDFFLQHGLPKYFVNFIFPELSVAKKSKPSNVLVICTINEEKEPQWAKQEMFLQFFSMPNVL